MNDLPLEVSRERQTRARIRLAIVALLVLGTGALLWRFTPIAEFASADRLMDGLESVRRSPWSMPAMLLIFTLGGVVFFPLTVLIAVTALMFEPAIALATSFAGTLLNALITYAIGARFLRGTAHEALGATVAKLKARLENQGIIAVAVVRTVPVAPFTAVNMAAGLIGLRLRDYVVGTALGVAPGIVAITLFGSQLEEVLKNPTTTSVLTLGTIVIGWIGLSFLLQRLVTRWQRRTRGGRA